MTLPPMLLLTLRPLTVAVNPAFTPEDRRRRFTLLAHASYTGWLPVLYPATSSEQGLIWQTGFALVLWVAVGLVMAGRVGHDSRVRWRPAPTGDAFGEPG